ncbi:F-box domain containing protein [Tanacetum coccineum]
MSDNIPLEIQYEVMLRLPVKSLLHFRIVSKTWKSIIDSTNFVVAYGARTSQPTSFLVTYDQGNTDLEKIVFGFGVHPVSLDPTIVKIAYPETDHGRWSVVVFKLSTKHWNIVPNAQVPHHTIRLKRSSQACIGTMIYRVASERVVSYDGISVKNYMIMSFDMNTKHFALIDIPKTLKNILPIPFYISKLENSLVLFGNLIGPVRQTFVVCVVEVNGGAITSFSNMYNIDTEQSLKLLGFKNLGEPIVEAQSPYNMANSLKVYQHFIQHFHHLGIEGDGGSFFMSSCIDSLVMATEEDCVIYYVS